MICEAESAGGASLLPLVGVGAMRSMTNEGRYDRVGISRGPSSDPFYARATFSHKWEKGAPMVFLFPKQKKLKLNLTARTLLPLVGEGGPAKRDRMRGAAETASRVAFRHGDFAHEPVARLIGQELQRLIPMRHLLAQIAR